MMKGVCLRYARNEDEAEDYLQEAFIRAFRSLDQFDGTGNLGAWLRKIAMNIGLEMYRKNKSIDLKIAGFSEQNRDEFELDTALSNLAMVDLVAKIQRLPLGFRTVFNLYAIEGYTHVEIAELLNISQGTSKSQYSRSKALLRTWIEAENIHELKQLKYAKG